MLFQEYKDKVLQELQRTLSGVCQRQVAELVAAIERAERILVGGAGRSGLVLRCFTMRLMHLGLDAHFMGEITTPSAAKGDLIVFGSGSGRTASLISRAQKAQEIGCDIALITATIDSPLGCYAHHVIEIPKPTAGFVSFQPMGNWFEQAMLLTSEIIIMMLMKDMGITEEEMFQRHANIE